MIIRKPHIGMEKKEGQGCGTGMDKEMKCLLIRSLDPKGTPLDGRKLCWQVSKRVRNGKETALRCEWTSTEGRLLGDMFMWPGRHSYCSDRTSLLKHKAPYSPRIYVCCTNITTTTALAGCPTVPGFIHTPQHCLARGMVLPISQDTEDQEG